MKMLFKNMETHSLMTRDPQSETPVKTRIGATYIQQGGHDVGHWPNVMATLLNIGGALCSMPQSLAYAYY